MNYNKIEDLPTTTLASHNFDVIFDAPQLTKSTVSYNLHLDNDDTGGLFVTFYLNADNFRIIRKELQKTTKVFLVIYDDFGKEFSKHSLQVEFKKYYTGGSSETSPCQCTVSYIVNNYIEVN